MFLARKPYVTSRFRARASEVEKWLRLRLLNVGCN